jgi:hypothetical protein
VIKAIHMLPLQSVLERFNNLNLRPLLWPAILGLIVGGVFLWQHSITQIVRLQAGQLSQQQQKQLFEDHLQLLQQKTLQSSQATMAAKLAEIQSDTAHQKQVTIDALYVQYQDLQSKVSRNTTMKLDVASITAQYADWGQKLLAQQFDPLKISISAAADQLDAQFKTYQASLITPSPTKVIPYSPPPSPTNQPAGYSVVSASTSRGNFTVNLIKMSLSSVTVRTISVASSNCSNQCPTKSLAQYVTENGAYAGINGTYFCPPDYNSCSGKTNTFDFALYNSSIGQWLNQGALGWTGEGLATFSGHSAQFYQNAADYDGHAITAGIANSPTLLVYHGQIIITDNDLDSSQRSKGLRGALGTDGQNIYVGVVLSASISDAAAAMLSLGATNVLNLDGGGSSALYIAGSYKIGPGRSLPNAVVLMAN